MRRASYLPKCRYLIIAMVSDFSLQSRRSSTQHQFQYKCQFFLWQLLRNGNRYGVLIRNQECVLRMQHCFIICNVHYVTCREVAMKRNESSGVHSVYRFLPGKVHVRPSARVIQYRWIYLSYSWLVLTRFTLILRGVITFTSGKVLPLTYTSIFDI